MYSDYKDLKEKGFSVKAIVITFIMAVAISFVYLAGNEIGINNIGLGILILILTLISIIDIKTRLIPDTAIIIGLLIGLFLSFYVAIEYNSPTIIINKLSGALFGLAIFLLLSIITDGGVGGGDIKLAGMIGIYAGLRAIFFISTISISMALIFFLIKFNKFPFAPVLTLSTLIILRI